MAWRLVVEMAFVIEVFFDAGKDEQVTWGMLTKSSPAVESVGVLSRVR